LVLFFLKILISFSKNVCLFSGQVQTKFYYGAFILLGATQIL